MSGILNCSCHSCCAPLLPEDCHDCCFTCLGWRHQLQRSSCPAFLALPEHRFYGSSFSITTRPAVQGPPPCPSPLAARSEDGDSRCDDVGSSRTGFTGPSDLQPCHRYSLDDLLLLFSSPCSLTASVDFTLGLALQVRLSVVMPIMSLCIMASSESGRGPARGYLGYCNEM